MTDKQTHRFSPELEREVAEAMTAYAFTLGAPDEAARLQAATDHVCRDAHQIGMLPERMVIELKHIYGQLPKAAHRMEAHLQVAYDTLLDGCIHAYFHTKRMSPPPDA